MPNREWNPKNICAKLKNSKKKIFRTDFFNAYFFLCRTKESCSIFIVVEVEPVDFEPAEKIHEFLSNFLS